MLQAVPGMARIVRTMHTPPPQITAAGVAGDHTSPVGFSAALVPYLEALGERQLAREQVSRMRSSTDGSSGLLGRPPKYYDQNLALFALGAREGLFWFDARGRLRKKWMGQ
jgi:endoglucanase